MTPTVMGSTITQLKTTKTTADDIMRLCLHCGYAGNIETTDNQNYTVQIYMNTEQLNPIVNDQNHPTEEKLIHEKCPVFCLQVPSEVFYVRRNGKGCWTGNSRESGQSNS